MHNKWILPLHRQLRDIYINELSPNLRRRQQQQLDSPDKLNEAISNGKNECYSNSNDNNIDIDMDKDYESELNGELDNNLNAYSLQGAYGRQAFEFFISKSANNLAQGEALQGEPAGTTPSARKLEAGRINQRWKRHRRLNSQNASVRLLNSSRPNGIRINEATKQSHSNQGDDIHGARSSSSFDWTTIYRDQIYRFDDLSRAVVIPKSIYSSRDRLGRKVQTRSESNVSETITTTPPDILQSKQAKQFIFGSRHTMSFWMRHAPFKFPPSTNEMLSVEINSRSSSSASTKSRESYQSTPSMNISNDDLDELAKHVKEHLLCGILDSSDGKSLPNHNHFNLSDSTEQHQQRLNKHHHYYYALFVRNCKLILLMRRQLNESHLNDAKNYLPTEWRWSFDTQTNRFDNEKNSSNKICDNKWHLYTINVYYPTVELYVDGQQFEENYNNLVIVDDLPVSTNKHSDSSVDRTGSSFNNKNHDLIETSDDIILSVGACWDKHHQTWSGHFRGSLSGLSVLMDENDDTNTIECLGRCSEEILSTANSANSLPMHDQEALLTRLKPDSSSSNKLDNSLISYQESQSKILLNGHDFIDIEDALSQIAYTNNRLLPSVGKRSIVVNTNVECQSQQAQQSPLSSQVNSFNIPIEQVKVEVSIFPSKILPVISLSGITNIAREYMPFMDGINLFSSIKIHIEQLNLQTAQQFSSELSFKLPMKKSKELYVSKSQSTLFDQYHDSATSQYADYIQDDLSIQQHQSMGQQQVDPLELNLIKRRIEACSISVDPPLNESYETFVLPVDKLDSLQLYWRESQNGAIIYGVDNVENYQSILRSIIYKNRNPAHCSGRQFKLACSDMNGRLISNEYIQTLSIIHQNKQHINGNEISPSSASQSTDKSAKFANLRISDLPDLNIQSGRVDEIHKPISAKQQQHQQAINLLNIEQTTKLDRIAIAFLVFVVSLIVIMILIALTNLKEPSLKDSSFENSYGSHTNKQLIYDSDQALSYDIDNSTQSGCYYGDELMIDEMDDSEDDDDEDGMEEEEEEEEAGGNKIDDEHGQRVLQNSRYATASGLYSNQKPGRGQVKFRKVLSNDSSTTNTDLESLAWDNEALDNNDNYTIVMNPIVHGLNLKNYARSKDTQQGMKMIPRTFVTEQRPNKLGSMTQKLETRLSYHSPILTGANLQPDNCYDNHDRFIENDDEVEIEEEGDVASNFSEVDELRTSLCQNENGSPVNSATASSRSGSSSNLSSCSSDEELTIASCKHHRQNIDEDSSSSGQYELYHAHQLHFHHTCLKQLKLQYRDSDATTNASDTNESAPEEFVEKPNDEFIAGKNNKSVRWPACGSYRSKEIRRQIRAKHEPT